MPASTMGSFITVLLVGGLAGFIVFCLCQVYNVWQARNLSGSSIRPRRLRYGTTVVIVGIAIAGGGWAQSAFQDRQGYLDANDVFVVYGRRGVPIQSITGHSEVARNAVVAEFDGPAERAMLAALDLRLEQARRRRDAAEVGTLFQDSALLQEQASLRNQVLQLETLSQEMQRRRLDLEQDRRNTTTTFQNEEAAAEAALAMASNDLAEAQSRGHFADRNLARTEALLRSGFATQQSKDVQDRERAAAGLAASRHQNAILLVQRRREADRARFRNMDARLAREITTVESLLERYAAQRSAATERLTLVDGKVDRDRDRARQRQQLEVAGVDLEIRSIETERHRLEDSVLLRAPFAGRVIYRHPASQLAGEQTPILALALRNGFRAHVRVRAEEVADLRSAGSVQLALEAPILTSVVTARFLRSEPIPASPRLHLAVLECDVIPEILPLLANTQSRVGVRLQWMPSLLSNSIFLVGSAVALLGTLLLLLAPRLPPHFGAAEASAPTLALQPETCVIPRYLAFRFVYQLSQGALDAALVARVTGNPQDHQVPLMELIRSELRAQRPEADAAEQAIMHLAVEQPLLAVDLYRLLASLRLPAGAALTQ